MQKRPQTSHPDSRPAAEVEGRPQTHQVAKRTLNTRSNQMLPPVDKKKPQSALPLRAPQIRMAVPGGQPYDISGKYWDMASKQTEVLLGNQVPSKTSKRPMTAYPPNKPWIRGSEDLAMSRSPLQTFEERLKEDDRTGPLQPKPFSFLSKLGGNTTHAESLVKSVTGAALPHRAAGSQELLNMATMPAWATAGGVVTEEVEMGEKQKQLITIFTSYDVDDYVKEAKRRPHTRLVSAQSRPKESIEKGGAGRPMSSYAKKSQAKIELKPPAMMAAAAGSSKRPFSAFPK